MREFVATFHTHLAALRSCNALKKAGIPDARLAPVPRKLSSSCGTCAFYRSEEPMVQHMDADVEAVYEKFGEEYTILHKGEE